MPYNPKYEASALGTHGGSTLATIPEDGPPPSGDFGPITFPEGPHKDDSDSEASTKVIAKPGQYCGKPKSITIRY